MFHKTTIALCSALLLATAETGAFAQGWSRVWGGYGGGHFGRFEHGYGRSYGHYGFGYNRPRTKNWRSPEAPTGAFDAAPATFGAFAQGGDRGWGRRGRGYFVRFGHGYGRAYERYGFGYDRPRTESRNAPATLPADDAAPAPPGVIAPGGGRRWVGRGGGLFGRFEHGYGSSYERCCFNHYQVMPESRKAPAMPPAADDAALAPAAATPSSGQEAINKILNDETLRPGDAYMAPDGLRVFMGASQGARSLDDFVAVAKAQNIEMNLRAKLAAYIDGSAKLDPPSADKTNVPAASSLELLPLASRPKERLITDSQGKTLRFVGGQPPQP